VGRKLLAAAALTSLVLSGCAFAGPAGTDTPAAGKSNVTAQRAAPKTAAPSKPATHQIAGTVVSWTLDRLVISHKFSGKPETMAFLLNPETKTSGKIGKSTQAAVRYRIEGGRNIAVTVRVISPARGKTAATTP
jgi:hypothetical protein